MKFFLAITLCFSLAFSDTFKIYTEELPPFNFLTNGQVRGSSTKLLMDLMEKSGHSITPESIHLVSWARGYHEALYTKNTILYSMARTAQRDTLFKWVGPIGKINLGLVAKKNKFMVHQNAEYLQKSTIAVMHNSAAEEILIGLGLNIEALERFTNINSQIKKLQENRVDAIASGVEGIYFVLKEKGLNPEDYETVYMLQEVDLYFAFHKDTDDAVIAQLNQTLQSIQK